jgi:protein-disulfide isomerase
MEPSSNKSMLFLSVAIIIAGIIVAGAIIYIKYPSNSSNSGMSAAPGATTGGSIQNLPPVTSADHIMGSLDAPVIIVEYADTDCPYCQQFQKTMQQVMATYGPSGTNQVAWVYRHFAFHPNAPKEAQATECAAELGGNDAFWQYLDLLFSKKDFTVANYQGLDPGQLPVLAAQIGLNQQDFTTCLESNKYATKVTQEYNDAIASGAQGTPFTVLTTATAKVPITAGAVPYANLKAAIDTLLNPKS